MYPQGKAREDGKASHTCSRASKRLMSHFVPSPDRFATCRARCAAANEPAVSVALPALRLRDCSPRRTSFLVLPLRGEEDSHQYATTGSALTSSFALFSVCSHAFISGGTVSEGMLTESIAAIYRP